MKSVSSLIFFGGLLVASVLQVACVDVNEPLESGDLPLHVALAKGDSAEVKRLLSAGADPNLQSKADSFGFSDSALEIALAKGKGDMDCIQALLAAGAKVRRKEIMAAVASRYPQYLRAMLDAAGEVSQVAAKQKDTPIWNRLCELGNDRDGQDSVACATLLLEKGISLHHPAYSHYPLHTAAMWENEDMVRYLLAQGFSANEADESGRTPLMGCNESASIARMLQEAGADVNAQDMEGCTPLMQCMMSEDVIRVLLNAGANPNLCNNKGETALLFHIHHPDYTGGGSTDEQGHFMTWIGSQQNIPVIKALIEKGADVNKPDTEGETPLQAVSEGEKEVRTLLINAGAK